MKICFCSTFLENEKNTIKYSKIAPNVSISKFNLSILKGLRDNVENNLTIFNTENIASFPNFNKIILKTQKSKKREIDEYWNIGKINLIGLKDITETIKLYQKLKKWIKNQNDDVYICAYGRRFSHVIAINILKKKYKNIKTCMILGDLSGSAAAKTQKNNFFKEKIVDRLLNFQIEQSKKFDSFVFVTKAMSDYLKVSEKPYLVIEGISSINSTRNNFIIKEGNNKIKIIAYSGILSKQYNVDVLLDAFQKIENIDYRLWIFGDGELKETIQQLSFRDGRINFFGFIPNEELIQKLLEATVLINPRQNKGEYTKYSFPSKTIEYLSLSKPIIGYELDGIPDEYGQYIFYVKENSIDSLKNKIEEVCEYSLEELNEIGKRNFEYVTKNKNSIVQTKKIIQMFEKMKD